MKENAISAIIGTIILCMVAIVFIHPSEGVKVIVAIISITITTILGCLLIVFAIFYED